jgi:hypothetical protein
MLAPVLERVIAFAARDDGELMRAKEEWAERAGRIFDDDPLYEEWTSAFLEWYALDRVGAVGRRPVERFLSEGRLDDLEGRWAWALGRSQRSLFGLREITDGVIVVDDLLGGAQLEVAERRKLAGLTIGDVFESRVVADIAAPPKLLFSRSFQFHPREAAPQIRLLAATARSDGEERAETLFRLLRLRLRARHYKHVDAARIYAGSEPE